MDDKRLLESANRWCTGGIVPEEIGERSIGLFTCQQFDADGARLLADAYIADHKEPQTDNRGNRWPAHKPPLPPEPHVARLMEAAQKLADAVDGELATLLEDDPWQEKLGNPMDEVREALAGVMRWLRDGKVDV
jgi:hypothetical protein